MSKDKRDKWKGEADFLATAIKMQADFDIEIHRTKLGSVVKVSQKKRRK